MYSMRTSVKYWLLAIGIFIVIMVTTGSVLAVLRLISVKFGF